MKKIVLMSTLLAILFTACKKEDSVQTPATPATPAKQLKEITKTENGRTTVFNLEYDGSKRVVSVKSTDNSEYTNFTYDGNGNVTKTEEEEDGFKNIYTYTYANGLPSTGTFKSWQHHPGEPDELIEDDLLGYTVTNNQVSKIHLNMTQIAEEMDLVLSYTNGNLSKVVSDGAIPFTATFSYGNKKSPFPKVYKYVLDQAGFSLRFCGGNEMLSEVIDFPGTTFDENISVQYTYDAQGYVLTSNDGSVTMKFGYE